MSTNNTEEASTTTNRFFGSTARIAGDAGRAIGSFLPTGALQSLTTRKYTLPDKSVASQLLMYRQLLHTKCRPGLKLSRPYQATVAQKQVLHMPWWEEGIEQTQKMTISYDNLVTRLWLNGAIQPFSPKEETVDTLLDEDGLPPIPHQYWVERLGFQQPDPVTDFRSGGVLSLAMMVYMVESCPQVCHRLFLGDASVLPFGITCINVTDMIAKFLMLAKSTDRMDALLSQKPFWRMFADPNAILAVQELAMTLLCDVVVEVSKERKVPTLAKQHSSSMHGDSSTEVSVFDFSLIVERTETRVRDDLLGAGPKTVDELRTIAERLRIKYQQQLERRIERAVQQESQQQPQQQPQQTPVANLGGLAANLGGELLSKMKTPLSPASFGRFGANKTKEPQATTTTTTTTETEQPDSNQDSTPDTPKAEEQEGDWLGSDITPPTEGVSNFSIGDEDEEEML